MHRSLHAGGGFSRKATLSRKCDRFAAIYGPTGKGSEVERGLDATGRIWLAFAALNGAVAVAMGAYARHGLAGDSRAQDLVGLAGEYQLWHALALIGTAILAGRLAGRARFALRLSGWLFAAGLPLFCGTLYVQGFGLSLPVSMTAPTGGTAFILGWLVLAVAALLARQDDRS